MSILAQSDVTSYYLFGSYGLVCILFYLSVAIVFYMIRTSEIKTMKMIKDPKAMARNRSQIGDSIKQAEKEKRMVIVWPVIVIKMLINYAKKNSKEKK